MDKELSANLQQVQKLDETIANSESELSEIVGITVKSEKYYVPEEEIILITLASQMGTVNKKTQEHYIELCKNYMVV